METERQMQRQESQPAEIARQVAAALVQPMAQQGQMMNAMTQQFMEIKRHWPAWKSLDPGSCMTPMQADMDPDGVINPLQVTECMAECRGQPLSVSDAANRDILPENVQRKIHRTI